MKKILFLFLMFSLGLTEIHSQISEMTTFSNQNWVNSMCMENDTIWAATSGGIVKWLKDGTLLKSYYKTDGLPYTDVTAIAIDKDGNKWLGGRGFAKFDGYNWTYFDNIQNPNISTGVGVYTIVVDSNNQLWCGTTGGGIYCFDGNQWTKFTTYNSGLIYNHVFSIAIDSDGSFWFGAVNGVSHYDGQNWTSYTDLTGHIVSIKIDDDNNKWFAHGKGFSKFDGTTWTHYNKDSYPELENIDIMSMAVDSDTIWLGTYNNGVMLFTDTSIVNFNSSNSSLLHGRVQDIYIDDDGAKYFSTGDLHREGGVNRYKNKEWKTYTTESPFAHNFIMALSEDNENNIWVGTYGGGAAKYDGENWTKYNTANSNILNNTINQIKTDQLGNIWFGTNSSLSKYKNSVWTNYTLSDGLPSGRVYDIEIDQQNNIWVATDGGGAAKYNGENWTKYNTANCNIVSNELYKIAVDSSNNIWVGSFDNGLSKFDGTEWTSFNTNNGALGHDYILSLEVDNSGNVWVAAGDAGIYKFDGDTWTNYKTSNSGILANSIFCSASDNNGLLWFGYGEIFGFGVFNGSEWAHYDVNNSNLPNNISYTIFSDSEDNIWIGTISGLSKFKYDSSGEFLTTTIIPNYQVVGYEAGSATFEISSNTSWSASDAADWLYFPTLTGNSNDKITAQYSYNHSEYSRTATITVSGTGVDSVTATIIQSVQTPTITVSPSNCHVSAESGSTIFNILSNTNWTASDDSDWLIISPSSGVNDATLTANYEENTTANARTATITVSGSGLNISATVTQDYYNSIYETTLSRQIKVYPTPAVNSIAVKFNDISQMVQKICMVDMQGRVVLIVDDNKLNSDNIQIDVSKLPKGVFYLNILLDKELVVKKIPIVR